MRTPELHRVGTRVAWVPTTYEAPAFGVIESVSVDREAPKPYRVRWERGGDTFTDLQDPRWLAGTPAERLARAMQVWPERAGLVGTDA